MTSCNAAEHDLLQRVNMGDQQAKEELYSAYNRLLYALSGRLSQEDSIREELVNAGYIGLLKAARRFDVHKEIRFVTYGVPWILGEMKKTLRVYSSRVESLSLDQPCSGTRRTLHELAGCSGGIDIRTMAVREAVAALKEEEQLLICLRYYRDMTQKEAALLLKKSQAQISRIERRAIDKLHAVLSEG